MALGKNISRLRTARGLTYSAVAEAVGTDAQTIQVIERRDTKKSKYAQKLADFFQVPLDDLTADMLIETGQPDQKKKILMEVKSPSRPYSQEEIKAQAEPSGDNKAVELIYATPFEIAMLTTYREASKEGVALIESAVETVRRLLVANRNLGNNGTMD